MEKKIQKSRVMKFVLDQVVRDVISISSTNQLCDLSKSLTLVNSLLLLPL